MESFKSTLINRKNIMKSTEKFSIIRLNKIEFISFTFTLFLAKLIRLN
jgi:hypothetical protein